jgi:hypothetical protein
MRSYEFAIVKFNGSRGALLCNECRRIIAEGFDHEDKVHTCEGGCPKPAFNEVYAEVHVGLGEDGDKD